MLKFGKSVFRYSNSEERAELSVLQHDSVNVAVTLKTPDLGQDVLKQALFDLAALSFADVGQMREFVLTFTLGLSAEKVHQVTDYLATDAMKKNKNNIQAMLAVDALVKTFLAYEFVHHKIEAVAHVQEKGALYSAIPHSIALIGVAVVSAFADMSLLPKSLPEVAFFLFRKLGLDYSLFPNDAATLKVDRAKNDLQAVYLNAVDRFIIKYFVAEIDEMRKKQKDRLMNDDREDLSMYRGGRKVAVGLAVRHAIVMGADISDIFKAALSENNLTYDAFFKGGTKDHLPEPLFSVLREAVPSTVPGAGRKG